MPDYRRWRQPGGSYFFTAVLQDRRGDLLTRHIETLRQSMAVVQTHHPFHIEAAVILPDHLHMIWHMPAGEDDFSLRWRLIKHRFSRHVHTCMNRTSSQRSKSEKGIWQRRFYEHLLRDESDFSNHVDYIHFNPVKHGYVSKPVDWNFSSIHQFIQRGILDSSWGTNGGVVDMALD